jgi:hypothetical protein
MVIPLFQYRGRNPEGGGMVASCNRNALRFVGALKIFDQNFMNLAQRSLLPSHPASISSWRWRLLVGAN